MTVGFGVSFEMDMNPLIRGTVVLDDRLDNAVAVAVNFRSHIAEAYMRQNAPWTDRTGNARSGMSAATEHAKKKFHDIILFYRVPYGIWLEVRFAGKYSIIIPTIVDQGPKLMRTLNNIIERLGGAPEA